MKILLEILVIAACVLVLLLIIGLFLKKEYLVSREVIIKKSKAFVFDYLKLLKNQNKFSVWATMDPEMKTEFRGTDGTPGFVSAWDSLNKNVGKGEQKILSIVEGEKIGYEIHFIRPFEGISIASISTLYLADNQTIVKWEFVGKMKYPMNLMLLFMNMEKMVGDDLNKGLKNLKAILEK